MSSRIVSKKTVVVLGGIFVFLVGTVAGSFLVLRSSSGEGKNFLLQNDVASSASLLEELARIAEEARLSAAPQGNATSELTGEIGALAAELDLTAIDPEANPSFSDEAINALLEREEQEFFPAITDADIKTSSTKSIPEYKLELVTPLRLITETFFELLEADLETIATPEGRTILQNASGELARATSELSGLTVPESYREAHKKALVFSIAASRTFYSLSRIDEDPARAIISLLLLEQTTASLNEMFDTYETLRSTDSDE